MGGVGGGYLLDGSGSILNLLHTCESGVSFQSSDTLGGRLPCVLLGVLHASRPPMVSGLHAA